MITYSKKDFNLNKIETINGSFNATDTKLSYHVYGLMQSGNSPVLIEQNRKGFPTKQEFDKLATWLSKNGIKADFGPVTKSLSVPVGIRRDVRMRPKFAAALVRTVIAFFEGAVKIEDEFSIPKVKLKQPRRKPEPAKAQTTGTIPGSIQFTVPPQAVQVALQAVAVGNVAIGVTAQPVTTQPTS